MDEIDWEALCQKSVVVTELSPEEFRELLARLEHPSSQQSIPLRKSKRLLN